MKFISWNIDSLNAALTSSSPRALLSRDVLRTIAGEEADVIAIQETKLPAGGPSKKHAAAIKEYFPDYHYEWVSSVEPARKGYAGTMILVKEGLDAVKEVPRIGAPDTMDDEGRLLTLEFDDFYFVNVYTPNAGNELKRLGDRQVWDRCYAVYLKALDAKKPVVACGDFNVAHKEIDLKNPKANTKNAGFTPEERDKMTNLLNSGFVDTFRFFFPETRDMYSWWSYRFRARERNAAWRIDYFIVSERLKPHLQSASIHNEIYGSDHCPVELELDL